MKNIFICSRYNDESEFVRAMNVIEHVAMVRYIKNKSEYNPVSPIDTNLPWPPPFDTPPKRREILQKTKKMAQECEFIAVPDWYAPTSGMQNELSLFSDEKQVKIKFSDICEELPAPLAYVLSLRANGNENWKASARIALGISKNIALFSLSKKKITLRSYNFTTMFEDYREFYFQDPISIDDIIDCIEESDFLNVESEIVLYPDEETLAHALDYKLDIGYVFIANNDDIRAIFQTVNKLQPTRYMLFLESEEISAKISKTYDLNFEPLFTQEEYEKCINEKHNCITGIV